MPIGPCSSVGLPVKDEGDDANRRLPGIMRSKHSRRMKMLRLEM